MADKNRVPPESGFLNGVGLNQGGRPRKDGSRADNRITLKELGLTKRDAARARLYASFSEEEFEAALDAREADICAGKRARPPEAYLCDRRANSNYEREARANIARIISTARLIAKAHKFDPSESGELLRRMAERTIELWTKLR